MIIGSVLVTTSKMQEESVEIERITKHDKKNSYRVKKNYIELTHSLFEDNSSLLIE